MSAVPLVKHRFPDVDITDDEVMTKHILNIAEEVQDFINSSYNYFAHDLLNCVARQHRFDIKQEVISKSAFWVTKKRYGQRIINDGGITVNKLDVKGLDIIKSNFADSMATLMKGVLNDILDGVDKSIIDKKILDFKKSMPECDISTIANPTGVKGISKYILKNNPLFSRYKKGTPIHVKSAMMYNDMLEHYGLDSVEPIRSGDKIKWVYLKSNEFRINSIAFKGFNDPPEVMDFIKKYIDYEATFSGALQKKVQAFYGALKWDEPTDSESTLERFF